MAQSLTHRIEKDIRDVALAVERMMKLQVEVDELGRRQTELMMRIQMASDDISMMRGNLTQTVEAAINDAIRRD